MDARATNPAVENEEAHVAPCFPEWVLGELDRLFQVRSQAQTLEERSQAELQAAILQDAADRYGRHLAESAEL